MCVHAPSCNDGVGASLTAGPVWMTSLNLRISVHQSLVPIRDIFDRMQRVDIEYRRIRIRRRKQPLLDVREIARTRARCFACDTQSAKPASRRYLGRIERFRRYLGGVNS